MKEVVEEVIRMKVIYTKNIHGNVKSADMRGHIIIIKKQRLQQGSFLKLLMGKGFVRLVMEIMSVGNLLLMLQERNLEVIKDALNCFKLSDVLWLNG